MCGITPGFSRNRCSCCVFRDACLFTRLSVDTDWKSFEEKCLAQTRWCSLSFQSFLGMAAIHFSRSAESLGNLNIVGNFS